MEGGGEPASAALGTFEKEYGLEVSQIYERAQEYKLAIEMNGVSNPSKAQELLIPFEELKSALLSIQLGETVNMSSLPPSLHEQSKQDTAASGLSNPLRMSEQPVASAVDDVEDPIARELLKRCNIYKNRINQASQNHQSSSYLLELEMKFKELKSALLSVQLGEKIDLDNLPAVPPPEPAEKDTELAEKDTNNAAGEPKTQETQETQEVPAKTLFEEAQEKELNDDQIQVILSNCQSLKTPDWNSVYVYFKFGEQEYYSPVVYCKKGRASFNSIKTIKLERTYSMSNFISKRKLTLEIWSRTFYFIHHLIGKVDIRLADLAEKTETQFVEFELKKSKRTNYRGNITIAFRVSSPVVWISRSQRNTLKKK